MDVIMSPFATGAAMAQWLYYAFLSHSVFVKTLAIVLPLELAAILANNVLWGIYHSYFWHVVTKPLPMVFIITATLIFMHTYGSNRFRGLVLTGLVLSLVADVLLIFEGEEFFLAGLGVFLMAHVMYIIAFSIPQHNEGSPVPWNYRIALYFVALSMIVPAILTGQMVADGRSKILVYAVVVYSAVIGTMGWRAAARIGYASESKSSQVMAFVGAILFIISDTTLAFNRFYSPVPYEKILVLSTYWVAQTLFVISLQRDAWHKAKEIIQEEAAKIKLHIEHHM